MIPKKKTLKNPIKFKTTLSDEQKKGKAIILENTVTVLFGSAGTSKTFLASNVALDLLFTKAVDRIIITRPTVEPPGSNIGFLPGSLEEKMESWIAPIKNNMYIMYDKVKVDKEFAENNIQIIPLQYTQGITYTDAVVIIDEAENATDDEMYMFLTRIGKDSKIILCGDTNQIMLKKKEQSGFRKVIEIAKSGEIESFTAVELFDNYRHPIVRRITELYGK
jgi:phosphate starvation-inducible PhoH-like protein